MMHELGLFKVFLNHKCHGRCNGSSSWNSDQEILGSNPTFFQNIGIFIGRAILYTDWQDPSSVFKLLWTSPARRGHPYPHSSSLVIPLIPPIMSATGALLYLLTSLQLGYQLARSNVYIWKQDHLRPAPQGLPFFCPVHRIRRWILKNLIVVLTFCSW